MAGVFKAYDVRGVYGQTLNEDLAREVGLAYASLLGQGRGRVVCGRDGRPHSKPLQDALIEGMRSGGLNVVNMGLGTTPMSYFANFSHGFDGSVMVTASHNPSEYNGFKFCRDAARPIGYEDGLDELERRVREKDLPKSAHMGELSEADFKDEYLSFLFKKCAFSRSFRFAVDCGNGMGGFLIRDFLEKTGQNAEPLFWDLDFSFPNHLANPLDARTLASLQDMVVSQHLDFGVAFDGDADRCFFVDDTGEIIPADILTTLIAVDVLDAFGPGPIIYDIRSSRVVREEIEARGGTPVLCRVGHSYMKAKLRERGGRFGGELAGHFYFRDFSYADSAFLTMISVMNILSAKAARLSELVRPFKRYFPSGEINFVTTRADELIEGAASRFPGGESNTIDGVRLDFPDWWFSLRKSNTEPLLRLVIEAKTEVRLKTARTEMEAWILGAGARLSE